MKTVVGHQSWKIKLVASTHDDDRSRSTERPKFDYRSLNRYLAAGGLEIIGQGDQGGRIETVLGVKVFAEDQRHVLKSVERAVLQTEDSDLRPTQKISEGTVLSRLG